MVYYDWIIFPYFYKTLCILILFIKTPARAFFMDAFHVEKVILYF
jgi:hypothetical protein